MDRLREARAQAEEAVSHHVAEYTLIQVMLGNPMTTLATDNPIILNDD